MSNTELNVRYGISALNKNNANYAINDEIMIDKFTGQIYYKRTSDGSIVKYETPVNISHIIINELALAINTYSEPIGIPSDLYVVSNRFGANADRHVNLLEGANSLPIANCAIKLSPSSDGFFICPRTNSTGASIIEYLSKIGLVERGFTDEYDLTIGYDLTVNGTDANGIERNGVRRNNLINIKTNEMSYIKVSNIVPEVANESNISNITKIDINIVTACCTSIATAYGTLLSDDVKSKIGIALDGMHELNLTSIDTVSVIDDISTDISFNPSESIDIIFLMNGSQVTKNIENSGGGTNVIVSQNKPLKSCIWYELTGK